MSLLKRICACLIAIFLFIPVVSSETYKIRKPDKPSDLFEGNLIEDISFPSEECPNGRTCNLREFMRKARVCALFALKDGKIILQEYATGNDKLCQDDEQTGEEANNRTREYGVASVTKSITSTLMGAAIAKYYSARTRNDFEAVVVRNVGSIVDRHNTGKIGKGYYKACLERVLNMRSGINWSDREGSKDAVEFQAKVKGLKETIFEFAKPYTKGIGNPFNYSALDASMNGAVAETLMGGSLTNYLDLIFWPELGMEARARWAIDKAGTGIGACCFNLTVADLARFGQFVLQKGQTLDGEALIPPAWFELATAHAPGDEVPRGNDQYIQGCPFDYHYQWWLRKRPKTDFTALGRNGEYVHIYPKEKVVIVQISDWQAWQEKYARPCLTLDAHDAIVKAAGG